MKAALLAGLLLGLPHGRIAYVTGVGQAADVALISADGRHQVAVTSGGGADANPRWSPSGRMLVYTSNRDGNAEVYLYLVDAGRSQQVTRSAAEELLPAFVPTGTHISFERWAGGELTLPSLWITSLYGTDPIQIAPAGHGHVWSSALTIAYHGPQGITVADRAGRNARALLPPAIEAQAAQWSPGGEALAFVGRTQGQADIFVLRADGTGLRNLTRSQLAEETPLWSPDGQRLAYVTRWPTPETTTRAGDLRRRIRVIDVEGRKRETITDGAQECFSPTWSPDGSGLAFVCCSVWPACQLYVADLQAKTMRPITERPQALSEPTWSPELVFSNVR